MPAIKNFRIVDDFYLWEAYQGINNGRTIDQFRIVDNFYLYQVVLNFFSTIISVFSWKDAGTFDYTDWQPNPGSFGGIELVLNLGSKEIITDFMINVNTPFSGGAITSVNLRFVSSAIPSVQLPAGTIEIGPAIQAGTTAIYEKSILQNFDGANYNLRGIINVDFLSAIDDLTAGEIQVFYKTTFQP